MVSPGLSRRSEPSVRPKAIPRDRGSPPGPTLDGSRMISPHKALEYKHMIGLNRSSVTPLGSGNIANLDPGVSPTGVARPPAQPRANHPQPLTGLVIVLYGIGNQPKRQFKTRGYGKIILPVNPGYFPV